MNCCVCPAATDGFAGVTAIDTSVAVVPVPLSDTAWGLAPPLSETLREARRVPITAGLKVTVMLQLVLGDTELPQVLVWLKSEALVPLKLTPVIFKVAVLLALVSVTVCTALPPTATLPKLKAAGERLTMVPLPDSATVCGLLLALSLILTEPVRLPIAVGVKVTLMVHLAPPARLLPQLFVCAKSPLVVMLVMLSDTVPVLVRVTGLEALVVPTT